MKISVLSAALLMVLFVSCNDDNDDSPSQIPGLLPDFETATFSDPTTITNNYYGPDALSVYIYEGGEVGMEPEEEIELERRSSTKTVFGITCIIQHDVVSIDGIIIEDTDDWLAQDDAGNLWYLGELAQNFDDEGNFLDTEGSWEAGIDGASPGYWLPSSPVVGQKYYQEYLKGEAEDQGEVLETNATVTIEMGTYENCLVTKDFTALEPDEYEKKYYAPGIGLIKEEKFEDDELIEVVELVEILEGESN